MKEDLSGIYRGINLSTWTPHRGPVTEFEAQSQVARYIPEFFDYPNSIKDCLFSTETIYIVAANERQIHYSFNNCSLAETKYPLVEMVLNHKRLSQTHIEEAIYGSSLMTTLLSTITSAEPTFKEIPYNYYGWYIQLKMGASINSGIEPQMLKIMWQGKEEYGPSYELLMAYIDMNGKGRKIVINPSEKSISLPHVQQTIGFSEIHTLKEIQNDQPFVFEEINIRENNIVDISYHGNHTNNIDNQLISLPLAVRALYP